MHALPHGDILLLLLPPTPHPLRRYANISLAAVVLFCLLEFVEMYTSGVKEYASDLWNLMDWINFVIFFMAYSAVIATTDAVENQNCFNYLCTHIGYFDDWKVATLYRDTKTLLSFCVCIQLFKILKFLDALVPKTGLATSVLRKCVIDLLFFGVTFIISMLSFSMMLYVQLGGVMDDYCTQVTSFIPRRRCI